MQQSRAELLDLLAVCLVYDPGHACHLLLITCYGFLFLFGSKSVPASALAAPQFRKNRSRGRQLAASDNSQSWGQMTTGKRVPHDDAMMGLIREAMALRVKYRLKSANGERIEKKLLALTMLCVNRHNRGATILTQAR